MTMFGVIVEGKDDQEALPKIIRKCFSEHIDVEVRKAGGGYNFMSKFRGFLEEFKHIKQGKPCDKALVIRDADNKDIKKLKDNMKERIKGRSYPFEVNFIIIVQELEAWFLADEQAISSVTNFTIPRISNQIEDIFDPKQELEKILNNKGIYYTPKIAGEIAEQLNLSTTKNRCPHFDQLCQALND